MLGGHSRGKGLQLGNMAHADGHADMNAWLREVGKPFAGQTIRYTSEATPPTVVANELKGEFEELTGIKVEIGVPLEQFSQRRRRTCRASLEPTISTISIRRGTR